MKQRKIVGTLVGLEERLERQRDITVRLLQKLYNMRLEYFATLPKARGSR